MKELKFLLIYIVLIVPTVLFGQGEIDRLVKEQYGFDEKNEDSQDGLGNEGKSDDSQDGLGNKVDEDNKSKDEIKLFDTGFISSTWGNGIQNSYTYKIGIDYVASLLIGDNIKESSGLGTTFKSISNFQTFSLCARYFLSELGLPEGLFGQAGLAFRNWSGSGEVLDDRTNAKIGSVKMKWSPLVFVSGLGWKKVWGATWSLAISLNGSIGGSRTIEYTENMSKFSDSLKKDLENKTDYPTNLVVYFGYKY